MKLSMITLLLTILLASTLDAQIGGPPAPTGLSAQQAPGTQPCVLLSWTASDRSLFFKIYRAVDDTGSYRWMGVSPVSLFADFNVLPLVTYHYAVTAVDTQMRESARSNSATITVTGSSSAATGAISGVVRDDSTGLAIPSIRVRFFAPSNSIPWIYSSLTDSLGQYFAILDSGVYYLHAGPLLPSSAQPYIPEWYENAVSPLTATPVTVHGGDTIAVDFGLRKYRAPVLTHVSGRLTDKLGALLPGGSVAFFRTIQQLQSLAASSGVIPGLGEEFRFIPGFGYTRGVLWVGTTDDLGSYDAQLDAGESCVAVASKDGFLPTFSGNTVDATVATSVHVGSDSSRVEFVLPNMPQQASGVNGTLRNPEGNPVTSRVILFPRPRGSGQNVVRSVSSNDAGVYAVDNVTPGAYSVLALPYSGYAPGYYKSGGVAVPHWENADSVLVTGTLAGIEITLQPVNSTGLATIVGTVLSAGDSTPVTGAVVSVRAADGSVWGWSLTDDYGAFTIEAVGAGSVTIAFDRPEFNGVDRTVTIPQGPCMQTVNVVLQPSDPVSVGTRQPLPQTPRLMQNYPNPFNASTTIRYEVSSRTYVRLSVFDLLGRKVEHLVDELQSPGEYAVRFNGTDRASGVYFYRLQVGAHLETRAMMLIR
jgi:hypothetical protein